MSGKKKFKLLDVILSVICVVFVAEAIAPAAAIGNQQFFWWIFLIITFLLPYGLIVSELGTAYADDEGGLYDWVRRAFGDKWGARVSWYYWINFPLWIASLAVLFPSTLGAMAGIELGLVPSLAIELAFIWIIIFISFSRASDAIWIMNVAAVLKVAIALCLGGLGIYFAATSGFASDMAPATFMPSFDMNALAYLSIILFNFLGFEVVATYASDMENPRVQIPKAIIIGGIVIAAKNAEALRIMNEKIKEREIEKYYLCVVRGRPKPAEGALRGYIFKDEVSGGWPSGAEQQPRRAQHETLCDGQEELALCQHAGWRAGQRRDLQPD